MKLEQTYNAGTLTTKRSEKAATTMSQRGQSRLTHRKYRAECESEIYHVTTRGVSRQTIFESDADRHYLLATMKRFLDSPDIRVELLAWCFMSNHIHIIAHAHLKDLSDFMSRVLSRYAKYFNSRHGRTGHLFEERFDSSPITTSEYLLTAVRYVHCNPLTAEIADLQHYQWSSFREYIGFPYLCKVEFVLELIGGTERFQAFHQIPNNDQQTYLNQFEYACSTQRPSDDQAIALARTLLELKDLSSIAELERPARNRALSVLKTHLSINQISRITGIGRNIVQRAK